MINYLAALGEPKKLETFFKISYGFRLTIADFREFLQVG